MISYSEWILERGMWIRKKKTMAEIVWMFLIAFVNSLSVKC